MEYSGYSERSPFGKKTPGQKTKEALLLEETARQAAKERQATSTGGEDPQLLQNFAEGDVGNSRDEVGEVIGVSGETIRKGTDVYRMAYPDEYVHDNILW